MNMYNDCWFSWLSKADGLKSGLHYVRGNRSDSHSRLRDHGPESGDPSAEKF